MKKKTEKKIKMIISGTLITATIISLIPNIKYSLVKSQLSGKINVDTTDENEKTKQVCDLFADNINKNVNLDEDTKKNIIDSFTKYFLKDYAKELSEETIINMCAVARTETIKEFNNNEKKDGIYLGTYYTYFNCIELINKTIDEEYDKKIWAHEQLHAILKNGWFNAGITSFFDGRSINEGTTSLLIGDNSYQEEQNWVKCLSCVIGYDKMKSYFFNYDINGLINELSKYMSKDKVKEMIYYMDFNLHTADQILKLESDNLDNNELGRLRNEYKKYWLKIRKLFIELYEGKISKDISEDYFGNILLNSLLREPNSGYDDYYIVDFDLDETIVVTHYIYNSPSDIFKITFNDIDTLNKDKKASFNY